MREIQKLYPNIFAFKELLNWAIKKYFKLFKLQAKENLISFLKKINFPTARHVKSSQNMKYLEIFIENLNQRIGKFL